MSGFTDQSQSPDEAWKQYLAGVSIASLAATWGVTTSNMTAVLKTIAHANGQSSDWTSVQIALWEALQ